MFCPWSDRLSANVPISIIITSHSAHINFVSVIFDKSHRAVVSKQPMTNINKCLSVQTWRTDSPLKGHLWVPLFVLHPQYISFPSFLHFNHSVSNLRDNNVDFISYIRRDSLFREEKGFIAGEVHLLHLEAANV